MIEVLRTRTVNLTYGTVRRKIRNEREREHHQVGGTYPDMPSLVTPVYRKKIGWNRELENGKTGFLDRWGSKYLGRGVLSVGDGEGSGFTQRSRIHFRGELEPTVERMNYIVSRGGCSQLQCNRCFKLSWRVEVYVRVANLQVGFDSERVSRWQRSGVEFQLSLGSRQNRGDSRLFRGRERDTL